MKSVMLAGKAPTDLTKLVYPVFMSAKIDGVRAYVKDSVVYSRTHKPIPNSRVQDLFGRAHLNGLDGELCVGAPFNENVFRKTTSLVMSDDKIEDGEMLTFSAFDIYDAGHGTGFRDRLRLLERQVKTAGFRVLAVRQELANNAEHVEQYEAAFLELGYEGAMIRSVNGNYKEGRATTRSGQLLKLKRFEHGEAQVIGFEELQHNKNEEGYDGKRTTHAAGKVSGGTLGALVVRDFKTLVEFNIGTGFTAADRAAIWRDRDGMLGRTARYKYFPTGSKTKPRFPVFAGWRDPADM